MKKLDKKLEVPPCNPEKDRELDETFDLYFCKFLNKDIKCPYRIILPMFGDRRFVCDYEEDWN
jgi:hypothetical protein